MAPPMFAASLADPSPDIPWIFGRRFPSEPKPFRPSSLSFSPQTLAPLRRSCSAAAIHDNRSVSSLKSRLRQGETLYGLFLISLSPVMAEIAALAGYDFIIVDMEHGPGGISEALACMRAIEAAGATTILRVPHACPTWTLKALDLGPQGIMFPMIESGKAAEDAVSYCRFSRDGVRGCASTFVRDSKCGFDEGYIASYADRLLIMCQVESAKGVEKIQDIVAVDGVDCVMIGRRDLSATLGYLRDQGNGKVVETIRKAEMGVLMSNPANGGAYLSGMATPYDKACDLKARGYRVVIGAADILLMKNAVVEDLKGFKQPPVSQE